ncbi:hypothetical protein XNC1_0836 [Xenorhabdus nematophila ATCC 19061]|uniref:Uncharacterized protein n=1 Tax=Xenorhabdus nematophila (strain ATCC 19061 / DSM 3370 / CCUG 14189 / LMG 1036 / NCIMB 9965 / AN6) TaxID=406817 RepID=D3VH58_XENNA|nr:hypothetical protein XNC1_0255 [Xenorhabdus nematophila ATCC 19061]CBJ88907.1 hypothetical protein XNC1_0836 [Xenorhabdus nematophila ATCC 19061]
MVTHVARVNDEYKTSTRPNKLARIAWAITTRQNEYQA